MKKKISMIPLFLFLTFLFLFLFLFFQPIQARSETGPFVGDSVMNFTLNTLEGKPIKFSEFRHGKIALIVFWASWCKDSRSMVPKLNEIHKKYAHNKFGIFGINTGVRDNAAFAREFQKENNVEFTLVFDKGSKISNQFMVMGTPRLFLVNKKGIIIHSSEHLPKNLDKIIKGD